MSQVNTLVITGYGTNSHQETAHAARLAGADRADVVHFSDIVAAKVRLSEYQFLVFPGGFLDGDDLGAAQAAAQRWLHLSDAEGQPLLDSLNRFVDAGGLVLGICNGFQLCIFTKGLAVHGVLPMPVRHGEGKLVARDAATLQRLQDENLIALQYTHPETGEATQEHPWNPNGSPLAIAGLTDPTGHILGLMPHPEAFHHATNHPGWTRGEVAVPGTALFANAVRYLRENPVNHS